MPALIWTDYVASVTGVVGMVTGISGAVMGYVGYRRSNQNKALDMRLALRKDLGEAHQSITLLRELMTSATGSRKAVLAARGLGRSGATITWEQALEADRVTVENLAAAIRGEDDDLGTLSTNQLESETVAVHRIKTRLSTLIENYRGELAADDEARRQIMQQATTMAAARMRQSGSV